jgi:hypothetical protein
MKGFIFTTLFSSIFIMAIADSSNQINNLSSFDQLNTLNWKETFYDDGKGDWKKQWFLDGEKGQVVNTHQGMSLSGGPEEWNHDHHVVLWTKKEFSGDFKITYDYTRQDSVHSWVTILYMQATGSGQGEYDRDITKWNHLRKSPWMEKYIKNMNLLHISYAAYGKTRTSFDDDYVRARRYLAADGDFDRVKIEPSYYKTAMFETGQLNKITVIKHGDHLYMRVKNSVDEKLFYWSLEGKIPLHEGRMGLRHMWMKSAMYADFRVFQLVK